MKQSNVIKGTLAVVALVAIIAAPVGLLIGTVSGFAGGYVDAVLMRITDIFLAFPKLILALAFVASQGFVTSTIVGATSGDTGSAAIEAFRGLSNVDVFIMYPHGRVSEVQRRQMTTPADANVHALAVDGTFDDCQARLKDLFNDHDFRDGVGLAGVNSINWARVLAQIVYYFTAAVSLGAPGREVDFTVPTGNFGDVLAGSFAKAMGLPIGRLVVLKDGRIVESGPSRTVLADPQHAYTQQLVHSLL